MEYRFLCKSLAAWHDDMEKACDRVAKYGRDAGRAAGVKVHDILRCEPDRRSQFLITLLGLASATFIGLLHYATGPDYDFYIFYLAPIIAVSWYAGRQAGLLVAIFSFVDWEIMDWLHFGSAIGLPHGIFNAVARLIVMLLVVHLAAVLRQIDRALAHRVAELAQANETLMRSNTELQRFSYVASHDLQTPLRSIAGFLQLLQQDYQGRLDARADELIDRVVASTRREQELIRDLLAYARLEHQAHPFQPADFQSICNDVQAALAHSIRELDAKVTCSFLPVVMGDRSQLAQLLQNLVENALKYHGPARPEVDVSAEVKDDEWVFSVRDNGIGIPHRQQARIFEIFQRLHGPQDYPGTGIGLAICRRVVEHHGGRIWVESEPGCGSTFRFTLPRSAHEASG